MMLPTQLIDSFLAQKKQGAEALKTLDAPLGQITMKLNECKARNCQSMHSARPHPNDTSHFSFTPARPFMPGPSHVAEINPH